MSLEAQELQLKMLTPIWPYFQIRKERIEQGIEVSFRAFVRKEIEGLMYKTVAQMQYILPIEEDEVVAIERLTIRFHDYCYKVLILGKPSMQEVDTDTRTEVLRLAQELL